jgi:hypothetical protein
MRIASLSTTFARTLKGKDLSAELVVSGAKDLEEGVEAESEALSGAAGL